MRVDRRAAAIMRILSGVVALTLLATGSSAQTLPDQQDALRALTSIRVEVQLVGAADRLGIESAEVRGAVESRLREAGITVSRDDQEPTRGDPMLSVTLHAIDAAGGYAFMVSVQFLERMVSLRRYVELVLASELPVGPGDSIDPLELMPSVRWEARALGTTSSARARTFIPESALGYIDRFLDDYQAANRI
jgi:hypothetical protein